MQIGMIGLGRMGGNMAERLIAACHGVVGYDRSVENAKRAGAAGVKIATSAADVAERLKAPRAIWLMLPHGKPTEDTAVGLLDVLGADDIIIDGRNSRYSDSARLAERCAARGVQFLDAGVSGGVWGRKEGFCLMVGGPSAAFQRIEPVFAGLAAEGLLRADGREWKTL